MKEQAIGGTESSIIKTAQILSSHYKVIVAQKFRQNEHIESKQLKFISKKGIGETSPEFIIVLRKYPLLKQLRKQFPKAKLFLWIHTYKNTEYVFKRPGLAKTNTTIICNSNTHRNDTHRLLNKQILGKAFSIFKKPAAVEYCYNPIKKPKFKQPTKDINKLLFFSSPNKGLKQIVESFVKINMQLPDLRLYIANPGYKESSDINLNANVIILGSLPHHKMMEHVTQSLCVFYPQDSFAETFGLIYAEANAYDTAVIAHDIGSAKEVLSDNNKLIDANNHGEILKTIKEWQSNYPNVGYNEKFSDAAVLSQWEKLLHPI